MHVDAVFKRLAWFRSLVRIDNEDCWYCRTGSWNVMGCHKAMSEVGFDTMKKTMEIQRSLMTVLEGHGLKDHEYRLIVEKLGREPNYTELGMFAVLWSEHCGYKHSRNLLKTLPTAGPQVLVGQEKTQES